METLEELREKINDIDTVILTQAVKRFIVVKKVGMIKKQTGAPIIDNKRRQQALEYRLKVGKKLGLSKTFITRLYKLLHDEAVKTEKENA